MQTNTNTKFLKLGSISWQNWRYLLSTLPPYTERNNKETYSLLNLCTGNAIHQKVKWNVFSTFHISAVKSPTPCYTVVFSSKLWLFVTVSVHCSPLCIALCWTFSQLLYLVNVKIHCCPRLLLFAMFDGLHNLKCSKLHLFVLQMTLISTTLFLCNSLLSTPPTFWTFTALRSSNTL